MEFLQNSLAFRYLNRLIGGAKCTSLKDLVDRLYDIEDGFVRIDARKSRTDALKASADRGGRAGRGGRGGLTATNGGRNNNETGNNLPSNNEASTSLLPYTSLPEKYAKLKPLTEDERQKLIRGGYCVRCREHGHHNRDSVCIFKKYQMPPRANVMSTEAST